ncbi:hypothetical protein N431DRAFT_549690, partial [Stipitochalara longipes BDJ]
MPLSEDSPSSKDSTIVELPMTTTPSQLTSRTCFKALLQNLPRLATSYEPTPPPSFTIFPNLPPEMRKSNLAS